MIKIKNASLVFPRTVGDLKIEILPRRHDRHTLRLKIDLTNECFYRVTEVFYGDAGLVYIIIEIDRPNPSNESNKSCFDRAIIKAAIDGGVTHKALVTFSGISFDEEGLFKEIEISELPLYGEYILKSINNKIYSFNCASVVTKDNRELPEIIVNNVRIHDTEKEIFVSWVGANAIWPQ